MNGHNQIAEWIRREGLKKGSKIIVYVQFTVATSTSIVFKFPLSALHACAPAAAV